MTTTLQDLKPSQIKPNKGNPRGDVGNVDELAASISEKGILEPLIVAPNGTAATFVLIAGHRRLAAAKQAKCKTVPCIVREDLDDPAEQLEHMLIENLQRTDLTPIEEAQAYQQLLEFPGYTQTRIVKATGRSAATVRTRLGLAKLPDAVRSKVHTGQLGLADAQAMSEFTDEPATLAKLEKAIGSYSFQWEITNARRVRAATRARAKAERELGKAGVRIVTDKDLEAITKALPDEATDIDGWVHVEPDPDRADFCDLQMAIADHASCPGHAATLDAHDGAARYVCTAPQEHPQLSAQLEQDPDTDTPADREQAAAARAARERINAELQTSAVIRRAHLAAVLQGEADDVDRNATARSLMRAAVMSQLKQSDSARELTAGLLLPNRANDAALLEQCRDQVNELDVEQLVVLLDLATNGWEDKMLMQQDGWRDLYSYGYGPYRRCAPWITKLTDLYKYQLTEPEKSAHTPPAVVDADLPEDDQ